MQQVCESKDKCDQCGERVTTKNTVHADFNDCGEMVEEGSYSYYKCGHCGFSLEWGSQYGEPFDHIDHRAQAMQNINHAQV